VTNWATGGLYDGALGAVGGGAGAPGYMQSVVSCAEPWPQEPRVHVAIIREVNIWGPGVSVPGIVIKFKFRVVGTLIVVQN